MFRECYRTATVRTREKNKGTDSLTVAVRNEASMLRECYRTATVREPVFIFHVLENSVEEKDRSGKPVIILLLVDDDEMSRDMIRTRLTRLGYVVITAVDGIEGIEAAREESPHLILMDLCMPQMDGFEAAKQLKADDTTAHIPIVALSALNTAIAVRRAVQAGCDSFQTKPVNLASLHNKIRRLVWTAPDQ